MAWAPLKLKLRGWGYSSPQSPTARPSPRLPRLSFSCGCRGCSAGCGATAARLAVSLALISSIVLVAMTFDVSNLEGLLLWVKENKLQGSLLFLVSAHVRHVSASPAWPASVAVAWPPAPAVQAVHSLYSAVAWAGGPRIGMWWLHTPSCAHCALNSRRSLPTAHPARLPRQLLYTLAIVLMVPAMVMAMCAGAIFGVLAGVVIVWLGSTVGQVLAFVVGRWVAHLKRGETGCAALQAMPRLAKSTLTLHPHSSRQLRRSASSTAAAAARVPVPPTLPLTPGSRPRRLPAGTSCATWYCASSRSSTPSGAPLTARWSGRGGSWSPCCA